MGSSERAVLQMVRCQVLTAANMKMTVFWVAAQCGLVEVDRYLRSASTRLYGAAPQKTVINSVTDLAFWFRNISLLGTVTKPLLNISRSIRVSI
jgi:hypothetical protein